MRAALIREIGLLPELGDVPEPEAGEGEHLVEIVAVPLNPIDINAAAGRYYGGHPAPPYVPGCEGVGRVVGSGELVWVNGDGLGVRRDGCLAERVTVRTEAMFFLPAGVDPALAGALGIAGLAGWLPLAWRVPVRAGDVVLVLGATGTVGLVAVQAARLLGAARVVAAGRNPEALTRAQEAGADATVRLDAGREELTAAFREACGSDGPTYIVDPLWGVPLAAALEAAAPRARAVNIGQSAGGEATLASSWVRGKELELYGHTNTQAPRDVVEREYSRLLEAAIAGDVVVDIERVPFAQAADAWRRQAEGVDRKLVVVL